MVGHRGRPLTAPFDFDLGPSEILAVVGRNGTGKSTWLRTMVGLVPPLDGTVLRPGRAGALAYLPQRAGLDDILPIRAHEVVALGTLSGFGALLPRARGAERRVAEALEFCGAAAFADRPFRSLSEGQRQRVQLARLAVSGAMVLLLDEPTSAMDVVAERETLVLLHTLRARLGVSIVVVMHFLDAVATLADRAILLRGPGQAPLIGPAAAVLASPECEEVYGRR